MIKGHIPVEPELAGYSVQLNKILEQVLLAICHSFHQLVICICVLVLYLTVTTNSLAVVLAF